jgi:hypothetical protein
VIQRGTREAPVSGHTTPDSALAIPAPSAAPPQGGSDRASVQKRGKSRYAETPVNAAHVRAPAVSGAHEDGLQFQPTSRVGGRRSVLRGQTVDRRSKKEVGAGPGALSMATTRGTRKVWTRRARCATRVPGERLKAGLAFLGVPGWPGRGLGVKRSRSSGCVCASGTSHGAHRHRAKPAGLIEGQCRPTSLLLLARGRRAPQPVRTRPVRTRGGGVGAPLRHSSIHRCPEPRGTQAAYAAPLILLAQTRQAERDHAHGEQLERHREQASTESRRREQAIEKLTDELRALLETNTQLTREIHGRLEP